MSEQIKQTLVGETVMNVTANAHPHAFAWYTGDPNTYHDKLKGKKITGSTPGTGYTCGGNTEVLCEDLLIVMSTPIKYHAPGLDMTILGKEYQGLCKTMILYSGDPGEAEVNVIKKLLEFEKKARAGNKKIGDLTNVRKKD